MATFFDDDDLANLDAYKKARDAGLKQIGDKPVFFVYSSKHTFEKPKKTQLPIFIFEKSKIADGIVKDVKSEGSFASGSCLRNASDVLVMRVVTGRLDNFNLPSGQKWQEGEALATDRKNDDTQIDLAKGKLSFTADMLKRQQKKLDDSKAAAVELAKKADEARAAVEALAKEAKEKEDQGDKTFKTTDDFKQRLLAARQAATTAASAKLANANLVKGLEQLLDAIAKAPTDQDKADVLFDKGGFGEAIKDLEGTAYKAMMATDEALMVLGRTEDTWKLQMSQEQQPRALAVKPELYSLPANDAFMKGGIDIKARFQLVTPLSDQTVAFLKKGPTAGDFAKYVQETKEKEKAFWSVERNAPAVSAREVMQLLVDGYWFGVYPKDPKNPSSELVQMMFPKALKPDVHKELLGVFSKMKSS